MNNKQIMPQHERYCDLRYGAFHRHYSPPFGQHVDTLRTLICLFLMPLSQVSLAAQPWQYEIAANAIYQQILENAAVEKPIAGMLHSLYLLQHQTADRKLVALSKYYLGSTNGEELDSCITNRGSAILPLINEALDAIEPCTQSTCVTPKHYISRLHRWKSHIEDGEVIEFVP